MGYEIRFVPSEEKMKEYKPWNEEKEKNKSFLEEYKRDLVHYCMKEHEKAYFITQMSKDLGWKIRLIYSAVEDDEKKRLYYRWKEDEKHEVWYCGWEFSRDSCFEKDDFIETKINDLLVFADLIKTPDYFEDSEKFYKKLTDVREEVDAIVEIFEDIVIHNIIDDLKEFEEKDDEEEEENTQDGEENV